MQKVTSGKKKGRAQPKAEALQAKGDVSLSEADEESLKELVELQKALRETETENKKQSDKLLRVLAEFENYKKRVARDHEDRVKYSHEKLVTELLPALDDFDRILEHLPEKPSEEIKGLLEGVRLIHRQLLATLGKFELKEVSTGGKTFDPHLHEAVAQVESDRHKGGNIVECLRKGYRLHDRLIRPAMVTVAKNSENKQPGESDEKEKNR